MFGCDGCQSTRQMSKMQEGIGLQCNDCNDCFDTATALLKHFTRHVIDDLNKGVGQSIPEKRPVPDLFPLNIKPKKISISSAGEKSEDNGTDSGFEDSVNPLNLCLVTMDSSVATEKSSPNKKYSCTYCSRSFGWSTDLKRHTFIHTGQRPFNCDDCSATFTRKSHLNKHSIKQHDHDAANKRKQDKSSIKKRCQSH